MLDESMEEPAAEETKAVRACMHAMRSWTDVMPHRDLM